MDDPSNGSTADPAARRSRFQFMALRAVARLSGANRHLGSRERKTYSVSLQGMPEVRMARSPVAPRECIPWLWIYAPVVVKWVILALRYRSLTLPTAANPWIVSGGFRGESKASYLKQVGGENQCWIAPWTTIRIARGPPARNWLDAVERTVSAARLTYPFIVKPDIGASGYGVRLVRSPSELDAYIAGSPPDQDLILQQYVPWDGEAGLFYVRDPDAERGRIFSFGLRYYPHVIGNGRSNLRQLIKADPRAARRVRLHFKSMARELDWIPEKDSTVRLATVASLRVGALYRDGSSYITPALVARLDEIARSMPDFHYGRFDIKFRSIDDLMQGEGFLIVEINGAGAEAIHIWDPALSLKEAYRVLFEQHDILFSIAAQNRVRGFQPMNLRDLAALQWRESRLLRRYPPSN
jgi:hypothetical protein